MILETHGSLPANILGYLKNKFFPISLKFNNSRNTSVLSKKLVEKESYKKLWKFTKSNRKLQIVAFFIESTLQKGHPV